MTAIVLTSEQSSQIRLISRHTFLGEFVCDLALASKLILSQSHVLFGLRVKRGILD